MALMRVEVTLPPATRPVGGLLAASRSLAELTSEWQRGVTFSSDGCVAPTTRAMCDADTVDTPGAMGEPSSWEPLVIRSSARCSAMNLGDMAGVAEARLETTQDYALARELLTGEATDNPKLLDGTVVASDLDIIDAVACAEQSIGDNLFGAVGFIHASPLLASHMLAQSLMWRDGQRWRTASGNVVVVSAGYTGSALHATTEVWAGAGSRSSNDSVDQRINEHVGWADEIGLAVFDPCFNIIVETLVGECEATSQYSFVE